MIALIAGLTGLAFVISIVGTWCAIRVGRRVGALDSAPIEGQTKDAHRSIPNTGGIAIAAALWSPILIGLLALTALDWESLPGWIAEPLGGYQEEFGRGVKLGWALLGCVVTLHIMGVIDDRRPMSALPKLVVMLVPALVFAIGFDTRLLTMLDPIAGGPWLSVLVTVVWIVMVTNAMNFIDNMDGLSAGITLIAGALFLVAAIINAQWFVGAVLALLVGGCAGFLVFNFPPAKVFMGDGGSLVIGFVLAITTVRTTYIAPEATGPSSGAWYAVLMPIAVLAVPLYDFTSVTTIRILQGKSPFKGDLQHFSHRIRDRGLSGRATVLVIYALTASTGIGGILLTRVDPLSAALIGAQIFLLLGVIAFFEFKAPAPK